jgi:hypothetical protein
MTNSSFAAHNTQPIVTKSVFILALFALLTLLATHPLWQQLSDALPGDVGDPVLNASILAWDAHLLVTGPAHLFDGGFYYPLPNALAYTENLTGSALLALPIILIGGQPALAYNFVFLLSFILSGYAMYLLLLHLTRNRAAGLIAGITFAFAPYHLASLAHIQLLTVQWLPLMVLALVRALAEDGRRTMEDPVDARRYGGRWFVLFFIFLWLQIASTLHGAAFAALIVLVVGVLHGRHLRALATQAFIAPALVFLIALIPLVLPYFAVFDQLRAARPASLALSLSAVPTDFLASTSRLFGAFTLPFRQRSSFTEEQVLFMGLVAPLLALAGLVLSIVQKPTRPAPVRFWDAGAGFALVLALSLAFAFGFLIDFIPLASIMRVPARWTGVSVFAIAGLCGLAINQILTAKTRRTQRKIDKTTPRIGRLRISANEEFVKIRGIRGNKILSFFAFFASLRWNLIFVLGTAIFAEGFAAPVTITVVGTVRSQQSVYQHLASLPGHEAVLELPMYVAPDAESPEAKRMYASLADWRPRVNGYSGITPPRQSALGVQMKDFPGEQSLAALRDLSRQGVRYLIVHLGEPGLPRREWNATGRAKAEASGVLRFIKSFDDNDLFEIAAQ